MSISFNQKLGLTVSFATLLLIGLANTHLRAQSKSKQLSQQHPATQNLSQTQQQNSAQSQQQISSASSQENTFIVQQTSDKNLDKQKTRASEQKSAPTSTYYQVIDELQKYKFSVQGNQVFASGKLPTTKVSFNQSDLLTVLVNTRKYYQDYASEDPKVQRTGLLATQGVTVQDILKTLDFMISVLQE
ncbi:MAG: hypothetical protein ACREPR_02935, partial [Brasilonema sp.]